jgi:hypothetical protein
MALVLCPWVITTVAYLHAAAAAAVVLQYMWEAASHEIGHNMGLYHDGDQSTPYYEGHGIWAPIMVRMSSRYGALRIDDLVAVASMCTSTADESSVQHSKHNPMLSAVVLMSSEVGSCYGCR